jgi:hypothetical protein
VLFWIAGRRMLLILPMWSRLRRVYVQKGAEYMALDFTVVVNVRHQFGNNDGNIGVFAGRQRDFTFDCPGASAEQAILLFQSLSVGEEQLLQINGTTVFGGVPATDVIGGFTTGLPVGSTSVEPHGHDVRAISFGWTANVLLVNPGTLREDNNVLHVESSGDEFVIDNVVVLYKVRSGRFPGDVILQESG